jgi:predicted phosphoribosyltransferase
MFTDREDAGKAMGEALEKYKGEDVLVLGIPRGGIEPAYYVARALEAELGAVVVRKLGHPQNPEAAFGAIAEDGSTFYHEEAKNYVSREQIDRIKSGEQEEIERRVEELRGGDSLPPMEGRTVILVDDGIATGATMFACIEMCKNQGAAKIVVVVPVGPSEMKQKLKSKVDEAMILETPAGFRAVSQGYRNFYNVTMDEAKHFLEKGKEELAG